MGKGKYPTWAINKVQSKVLNINWGIMVTQTTTSPNQPTSKMQAQQIQQHEETKTTQDR